MFINSTYIHKLTSVLLFLICISAYFITSNKSTTAGSHWVIPTSISIIKNHTTNLDEYRTLILSEQFSGADQVNGHLYAHSPIVPALIAVPFVWACELVSHLLHYDFDSSIAAGGGKKCELFIAASLTALSIILIYLIAKKIIKINWLAILMALVFAFCTSAWSTASTALNPQTIVLLVSSFLVFLFIKEKIDTITVAIIGVLSAIGLITDIIYLPIFTLFALFILIKYRSYFFWYIAASCIIIIPFGLYNQHMFGSFFYPAFNSSLFNSDNFLIAFAGNLISPARGILIFSPIFVLSFIEIAYLLINKKVSSIAWLFILATCACYFIICSLFKWWGDWSFGPALLTGLVPFLFYFLILMVKRLNEQHKLNGITIVGIIILILISATVNYRGAASIAVSQWNYIPTNINDNPQRIWQWNDAPFLRFTVHTGQQIQRITNDSSELMEENTTFDKLSYHAILYDKKYQLSLLPDNYYNNKLLEQSFQKKAEKPDSFFSTTTGIDIRLLPLGYNESKNFMFEFTYPSALHYSFVGGKPIIPVISFPHPELTHDFEWAVVKLRNTLAITKTIYVRLFYQNTSYWFPTNDSIKNDTSSLDNFYGGSQVLKVTLKSGEEGSFKIPYKIGFDPKNNLKDKTKWLISARPGNYEFMALVSENENDPLMAINLNLNKVNPFAELKKDELHNNGKQYFKNMAYVGSHHFKFVLLDDDFDGHNDLNTSAIYISKDNSQKKLCDTCNGNWFKNVLSDTWADSDFFKGGIAHASRIKAQYGNRKENFYFNNRKAIIKIPGSTPEKKQKTWGEFLFEPSFKYGHVMVRAKFAQMFNKAGRPNGIIHNLWLYQRDFLNMPPDPKNPYHNLTNSQGNQPFEIDFEIWSSRFESQAWDSKALINYSVVDYMRDANVDIKPGEQKKEGNYIIDRLNNHQANIPGAKFDNTFFNYYHLYEIYWTPTSVKFLLDGEEKAYFTNKEVKIPDQELYLWIGSPIYQDGTYFSQTDIPFIPKDMFSEIDWIRIE